jgi:uncharacterized protein (TIGR02284 family)
MRKVEQVDSGCKPMGADGIYPFQYTSLDTVPGRVAAGNNLNGWVGDRENPGPLLSRFSTAGLQIATHSRMKRTSSMATDTEKNDQFVDALKSLINVLEDGQKGMAEIGEHLKDETVKRYFLAESLRRASFRGELENELHRHGIADVHESGTAAGSVYRAWAGLKAALGGGDHTLLETAEQGEDDAKQAYKDALDQDLPFPLRQLLTEQQAHIISSHDYVRDHRDALKAA